MNIDNGQIRYLSGKETTKENETPIDPNDMTKKQKEEMQISKFDNSSTLGQMWTATRKERRKQERVLRNQQRKESKKNA